MFKARLRLVILLAIVSILSLDSQDLLVNGAEWYCQLIYFGSPDHGVNRCYIEGDTTIDGKTTLIYTA